MGVSSFEGTQRGVRREIKRNVPNFKWVPPFIDQVQRLRLVENKSAVNLGIGTWRIFRFPRTRQRVAGHRIIIFTVHVNHTSGHSQMLERFCATCLIHSLGGSSSTTMIFYRGPGSRIQEFILSPLISRLQPRELSFFFFCSKINGSGFPCLFGAENRMRDPHFEHALPRTPQSQVGMQDILESHLKSQPRGSWPLISCVRLACF